MFGIVKTLVGYFAASVSQRFDVENPVRAAGAGVFLFFLPPVFLLGVVAGAAGRGAGFRSAADAGIGGFERAVAVPLYHILDKLKITG